MNENNNTITSENKITRAEVWEQIKRLQEQLSSLQETTNRMFAVNDTNEYDGDQPISEVNAEVATAKIEAIKDVFTEREKTLQSLLELYKTMYSDLAKDHS